jgi:phosphoribosylformylglycinamidine synthase
VAESCRNLATVGALPIAATNNLNFGNPERAEIMAQLVEAIEGMAEACAFFETPITGGNVSLYNETLGEGIYPTPVLGIIGLLKTAPPIPSQFMREDASIVLLGGFGSSDEQRFGSSQYAKTVLNQLWGLPPQIDLRYEKAVHDAMREIAAEGLAESAHDLSDGGVAVALAECCTGAMGATIEVPRSSRPELLLFGESPSRILISTSNAERIREIATRYNVLCPVIGSTIKVRLQIGDGTEMLIDIPAIDLKQASEQTLPRLVQRTLVQYPNAG